jgi:uncharacterized membrane protein
MVTWVVLLALIGFVVQLHSKLRALEDQLDGLQLRTAAEFDRSWQEPAAPDIEEEVALVAPAEVSELRQAVAVYGETPSSEFVSDRVETADYEEATEKRPWKLGIGFEELFGRRLPIWAGGITLAVAGMLIVKLSIESGLLKPPIRVISGLLFGAVLIIAAEAALRFEERIRDARVRQALAGAGVASLYASILVAVNLYHLIDALTAMLGMAAVTATALFLSIRFGAPSALLGLAGGLAAPALVGSAEPNVPLLSVYLALAVSGLCALSRNQRWAWLGISALIGGFGWGIMLLVGGILDTPSSISLGLYLLLLGVGVPALGFAGDRKNQLQLVAGIVAAAQMAALVAIGGFAVTNWALFAMLSIATVWLAGRNSALVRLPGVGLLTALLLMGAWTSPAVRDFSLVLSGFALIYGAPAIWRLWRTGTLLEAAEIGALGLAALLLPMFHFFRSDGSNDLVLGLLAAALSLGVSACAAFGWNNPSRRDDARFALLAIVTAVLAAGAALLLLPIWAAGVTIALTGFALLHLGQVAEDPRIDPFGWIFAAAGVLAYPYSELADGTRYSASIDALHWGLQAAIAGLFAWGTRFSVERAVAQFATPAFLYFSLAALVPDRFEPLIAPILLVATAALTKPLKLRLTPALASCLVIILIWALTPLAMWIIAGVVSLAGTPLLVTYVPPLDDALTELLMPGVSVAIAAAAAAARLRPAERIAGWTVAGVLGAVGVHGLYKHLFAIATPEAFVAFGLAERTVWEIALAALALIAVGLRRPIAGLVLACAAAVHETVYTLAIHNPLWAPQDVGTWPVVNLLLPAYGLAVGLTVVGKRTVRPISDELERGFDTVQMALVVLFAFSELRQFFHGTLLTAPGLPVAEDILRSILAIALAIGFLLWGIARQQRDWRIASLALMLGAVGKVFLFDASGLEGVTRIASFLALGLSLIGIGWLYSRHLGADRAAQPA